MIVFKTEGMVLLIEVWEIPDLPGISHLKVPVARNPRQRRTWMATGMSFESFVRCSKMAVKSQLRFSRIGIGKRSYFQAVPHSQQTGQPAV